MHMGFRVIRVSMRKCEYFTIINRIVSGKAYYMDLMRYSFQCEGCLISFPYSPDIPMSSLATGDKGREQ